MKVGIGQDSHRFMEEKSTKPCVIAGIYFEDVPGLSADSDGDVVFHAICNAITTITHVPILGGIAIDLCKKNGITDSGIYLDEALKTLGKNQIEHVALTIEGQRPRMQIRMDEMRASVANAMELDINQVGITVTSGDGLTDFGLGNGLQCFAVITTSLSRHQCGSASPFEEV